MSPPSRRLQTKPVITCLKTFLISYSLIFWFTGVILLAVGVWGKVSLEAYFSLVSEDSTNAPYVLIGTGAIIVVFGLFGCFATCRGSPWMLKLYAMFLTLVFLAELIAGVSGFIFRHEDQILVHKGFFFFFFFFQLHCCGMTNSSDWGKTEYSKFHGIPMSCCKSSDNCTEENMRNPGKGCFSLVTSVLESNLGIIAGVSFGIAFFQVIGIFLACCLSRYITNNQYEMV
uniref:Tetraspanin n=1 Tax=Xiphophorus couchianus TaxID=32473 RepID=A0A3B5MLM9_9TELE